MSRLDQLEAQQEALAKEIAAERAKVRDDVVTQVRMLIKKHSITLSEVKNVLTMRKPRAKGAAKPTKANDGIKRPRGRPRKAA